MRSLTTNGKSLILKCNYIDRHKAKEISGSRWDKRNKNWKFPLDPELLKPLVAKFPDVNIDSKVYTLLSNLSARWDKFKIERAEHFARSVDDFESDRNFLSLPFFDHQLKSYAYFKDRKLAIDFSEPGCGKTAVQIALIKHRLMSCGVKNILIICPKGIMEHVWYDDLVKFMYGGQKPAFPQYLINVTGDKAIALLKNGGDGIYIINFEKTWRMLSSLQKITWDMIIVDESSRIKNQAAKQTKAILKLDARFKSIMTGTPAPNSMLEIFPQLKFIDPTLFGTAFYAFKEKYFNPGGYMNYEWFLKPGAASEIKAKIDIHAVSWKKDKCLDLPSVTDNIVECELSNKQKTIYRQLQDDMIAFLNDNVYNAAIALTKILRLTQITSGFIQQVDGENLETFEPNPKLCLLSEIVSEIPKKRQIIIWANFQQDIRTIAKLFGNNATTYYGGLTDNEKRENLDAFVSGKVRIIVMNPASGGMGLNLSNANYAIYYSMNYSFEQYDQSRERFNRPGQTRKMTIYHLQAKNTIDNTIYEAVINKQKINDLVTTIKEM